MDADVNAGLATTDPDYIDTREGGFYHDITQVAALEMARLWDALGTDVPASAFPTFAWGDYLDDHADLFNITRAGAIAASGTVLFGGSPGTLVGVGTVVTAAQTDPDIVPPAFETTASGTLSAIVPAPTGLTKSASGTDGVLATATYFYKVTAINNYGESLPSAEVSQAVVAPQHVLLDWNDMTGATGYKVYRSTTTNTEVLLTTINTPTSTYTDKGLDTPGVATVPIADSTGGKLTLAVTAQNTGSASNVFAGAVSIVSTPVAGLSTVTNAAPIVGGANPESDESLRARILLNYQGSGAGSKADYQRWVLGFAGVGHVFVGPVWHGPGTVQIVATTAVGDPVSEILRAQIQTFLDPPAATATTVGIHVLPTTPITVGTTTGFRPAPDTIQIGSNSVSYNGLTGTTFTGTSGGAGTFPAGTAVTQGGAGLGQAPIGASVTVQTVSPTSITVIGAITHKPGYTLDGVGGTIATRPSIVKEATDYLNTLDVGEDVIYEHVKATLFQIGVLGVSSVTVNGGTADIVINQDPPAVARLGTITLS